MTVILGGAWILLAIINLIIYHKIFAVYYFDLGAGLKKEIFYAFFFALIEVGLIAKVGPYILIGIGVIIAITIIVIVIKNTRAKSSTDGVENNSGVDEKILNSNEKDCEPTLNNYSDASIASQESTINRVISEESFQLGESNTFDKNDYNLEINGLFKYCTHCGKQIKRGAKFCNFCGEQTAYYCEE